MVTYWMPEINDSKPDDNPGIFQENYIFKW